MHGGWGEPVVKDKPSALGRTLPASADSTGTRPYWEQGCQQVSALDRKDQPLQWKVGAFSWAVTWPPP